VTVAASSIEPTDDSDGDNIKLSTASFSVEVEAVADPADITVLNPVVTGDEDTFIKLPGLAVSLVDDVETNGPEVLSALISGSPPDTIFSEGSNNGDGSWTIPVDKLADLEVLFPLGFAGTVELTLTGITLELSNSDEAQSSKTFTVNVTPVADEFLILAKSVYLGAFGAAPLDLNIRMDDITGDGTFPGEISEEIITLTFNNVPTGVFLLAGQGGSLTDNGGGEFIFIGTEAQANALLAVSGPSTNSTFAEISISGVTRDGINVLDTPILDQFVLYVNNPIAPGVEPPADITVNGGLGSDFLRGLPGSVSTLFGDAGIDRLRGGSGADILTGGSDTDLFIYEDGDLGSGTDTITDFADGVGGDQLVLNSLLTGYGPQSSSISDFVQLLQVGSDTIVSVDANGSVGGSSFIEVAKLQGKSGLDVNQLLADGNLIV
jgi:Ca2+-binding RTX toxin-like protein